MLVAWQAASGAVYRILVCSTRAKGAKEPKAVAVGAEEVAQSTESIESAEAEARAVH